MEDIPGKSEFLAEQYQKFRTYLVTLAERYMDPMLCSRCSAEDIVQETFRSAVKHSDYFRQEPEIPMYCKWRTLLFHALTDAERRHLHSQKRNVFREIHLSGIIGTDSVPGLFADRLAASVSSPLSKVAKMEQTEMMLREVAALPADERNLLTLRQLDGCSAAECARLLEISPKEVNTCYVRALRHLRKRLLAHSGFRP